MPPGQEGVPFHQLPELVTRFLAHPEPIVIPYTIRYVPIAQQDSLLT